MVLVWASRISNDQGLADHDDRDRYVPKLGTRNLRVCRHGARQYMILVVFYGVLGFPTASGSQARLQTHPQVGAASSVGHDSGTIGNLRFSVFQRCKNNQLQ